MAEKKKTKSKKVADKKAVPVAPKLEIEDVRKTVKKEEPEEEPQKVDPPKAEPIREVSKPVVVESRKVIPKAHPASNLPTTETVECLVTCVKFVGGWRHLVKGKPITAPKEVIANLRQGGLVK